jgi:DhnA family fructose-bisphosphate aldolase class Ia
VIVCVLTADVVATNHRHAVVRSANRTLVLISGGTGLIFGRNIWQREYDEGTMTGPLWS